jgi:nitroreductase
MERKMSKLPFCALMATALTVGAAGASAEEIALPTPDTSSSLMKLIDARRSGRSYDASRTVSKEELSNVLWAAFGQNSHGTRTVPTARNQQDLKIFVIFENKVWKYDGINNRLIYFSQNDLMPALETQPFVADAPVHLIYAGGKQFAEVHTGSAYQNVALYAADKGLATVVRGFIDRDTLHKKLKLSDDEVVTYHQTIGYPAD